jgi:hypothetical protein
MVDARRILNAGRGIYEKTNMSSEKIDTFTRIKLSIGASAHRSIRDGEIERMLDILIARFETVPVQPAPVDPPKESAPTPDYAKLAEEWLKTFRIGAPGYTVREFAEWLTAKATQNEAAPEPGTPAPAQARGEAMSDARLKFLREVWNEKDDFQELADEIDRLTIALKETTRSYVKVTQDALDSAREVNALKDLQAKEEALCEADGRYMANILNTLRKKLSEQEGEIGRLRKLLAEREQQTGAAPELLEACQEFMAAIRDYPMAELPSTKKIEAAIAKATGKVTP